MIRSCTSSSQTPAQARRSRLQGTAGVAHEVYSAARYSRGNLGPVADITANNPDHHQHCAALVCAHHID
jgi:hypothetical protein